MSPKWDSPASAFAQMGFAKVLLPIRSAREHPVRLTDWLAVTDWLMDWLKCVRLTGCALGMFLDYMIKFSADRPYHCVDSTKCISEYLATDVKTAKAEMIRWTVRRVDLRIQVNHSVNEVHQWSNFKYEGSPPLTKRNPKSTVL